MKRLFRSLIPGMLVALQVAALGVPCAPLEPEHAGGHPSSTEAATVHAHHAHASGPEPGGLGAHPRATVLIASCPCGCTGGAALAAPTRNLGDALLLEEMASFAPQAPVPQIAEFPSAPPPPSRSIDHVPLQLG